MPNNLKKDMGRRLKKLRILAELHQKDIAKELGISIQLISYWETGKHYISMKHYMKLPKILKCKIEDLDPRKKEVLVDIS